MTKGASLSSSQSRHSGIVTDSLAVPEKAPPAKDQARWLALPALMQSLGERMFACMRVSKNAICQQVRLHETRRTNARRDPEQRFGWLG